jgi:protein-arginine kinase activator protein McsA
MSCDTCGKATTGLTELVAHYQTENIKMVCDDCLRVLNKQHSDIMSATSKIGKSWMRSFIENFRGGK